MEQAGWVSTFILVLVFAALYSFTKTINDLATQVDDLEKILNKQTDLLKSYIHEDNLKATIAFSARVKPSYNDIAPGTTIVFSDVETNIGNAYNGISGEFTAPRPGVYVFFAVIISAGGKDIETALCVNGEVKLLVYSGGATSFHGSGSNMLTVHLNTGDEVKMIKHGSWGSKPHYIHHTMSTFSGYMLRSEE